MSIIGDVPGCLCRPRNIWHARYSRSPLIGLRVLRSLSLQMRGRHSCPQSVGDADMLGIVSCCHTARDLMTVARISSPAREHRKSRGSRVVAPLPTHGSLTNRWSVLRNRRAPGEHTCRDRASEVGRREREGGRDKDRAEARVRQAWAPLSSDSRISAGHARLPSAAHGQPSVIGSRGCSHRSLARRRLNHTRACAQRAPLHRPPAQSHARVDTPTRTPPRIPSPCWLAAR